MGFDFTIAVQPEVTSINKELQYIKSVLLYADRIILISPMAYMYTQLYTGEAAFDEKRILKLLKFILPICEEQEPETYRDGMNIMGQLSKLLDSKQYKTIPLAQRIGFRNELKRFMQEIDGTFLAIMGESQTMDLNRLIKSGKLILQKFEHSLADVDGCVSEYFGYLMKSVKTSLPLFDEASNELMRTAVKSKIINLSESEKRKITHAGVSDNLLQRLPSFDVASVDEILDIRKELNHALVRFRSKVIAYSENIQALPWDDDFEHECSTLYYQEIAPAVLEIDELTKENGFLKNLVGKVADDGKFLKSAGGLVIGVAAAGVIPSLAQAISTDTAMLAAGGAWATTKIAAAYKEYQEKKREIAKKDLYFYYKAGKLLE
ncbi:MAG: hypothetical protein HFG56_08250 [Lachnospiraceae bacterium]|nr:hypothetical protein [Lachnospiraceae bacterium]MCI9283262.1 hypothetical protein [Lachnospiraceae bacterium]